MCTVHAAALQAAMQLFVTVVLAPHCTCAHAAGVCGCQGAPLCSVSANAVVKALVDECMRFAGAQSTMMQLYSTAW
jgi:hypothetical protein